MTIGTDSSGDTCWWASARRPAGRKRLIVFLAIVAALFALAAAWRWTPLQDWLSAQRVAEFMTHFSSPGGRALVAVAGVVLASVLVVPLTFLAIVGAVAFPAWLAFVNMRGGVLVGSALGFVGGRVMSRSALERSSGSRLGQLSRQLAKRCTIAVAVCSWSRSFLLPSSTWWPAPRTWDSGSSWSVACWG